jgi:hypothetical protein
MQNNLDTSWEKFGITLLLRDVAFSAELQRDSINQIMSEIETQLTVDGAPDDSEARVELMMEQVSKVCTMVTRRQIDHSEGVADIAYAFIYCLGKTVGFEQVENLRGLTGTFLRNVLSLNPCLGELEYQTETATLCRVMSESAAGDWELDTLPQPTIH